MYTLKVYTRRYCFPTISSILRYNISTELGFAPGGLPSCAAIIKVYLTALSPKHIVSLPHRITASVKCPASQTRLKVKSLVIQ